MPAGLHGSLPSWSFPVTLALVVTALLYWRGWYRLREALPSVIPTWRLVAFMTGLFSVWAAAGSPVAHLDHELLTAHMVQHLLLMTIGAPLILVGAPTVTLLYHLPRRFVCCAIGDLLRSTVHGLGRILAHPVFSWLSGTVVVICWHVPLAFDLGTRSGWHEFEQATFLAAGFLFWWPVVQPWPSVARWPRWSTPLYLFLATLPCDALSAFLTFCDHVVYRSYVSGPRPLGISALQDQAGAGALMWVWITFAYLIPAVVITVQILSRRTRASMIEVV